eukprot:5256945-Ditylum_brightwellii.AAC.1
MCQPCAAKFGLTELVYKDPIVTEDEESDSNKEGETSKDGKRHSNQLKKTGSPLKQRPTAEEITEGGTKQQ